EVLDFLRGRICCKTLELGDSAQVWPDTVVGKVKYDRDKPDLCEALADIRERTPVFESLESMSDDEDRLLLLALIIPNISSDHIFVVAGKLERDGDEILWVHADGVCD
ncbi:MAG: hypothetical protein V3U10_00880, partial [Bacteroidota bacterium]